MSSFGWNITRKASRRPICLHMSTLCVTHVTPKPPSLVFFLCLHVKPRQQQLETSRETYLNVFILGIEHQPPRRILAQRNLKSTHKKTQRKIMQDEEGNFVATHVHINRHALCPLAARKIQAQAIVSGENRTNRLALKLSFM